MIPIFIVFPFAGVEATLDGKQSIDDQIEDNLHSLPQSRYQEW
jgi:hypothetical protein